MVELDVEVVVEAAVVIVVLDDTVTSKTTPQIPVFWTGSLADDLR